MPFDFDQFDDGPLNELRGVNEILSDENKWTQGKMGGLYDGPVCLLGALERVHGEPLPMREWHRFAKVLGFCQAGQIAQFNDTHTFEEVKALLKEAIEKREKELV